MFGRGLKGELYRRATRAIGRGATTPEEVVATDPRVPKDLAADVLAAMRARAVSIHADGDERGLEETLAGAGLTPEEAVAAREAVLVALARLPTQEAHVLRMSLEGNTLRVIAPTIGRSAERVRQILASALDRLGVRDLLDDVA